MRIIRKQKFLYYYSGVLVFALFLIQCRDKNNYIPKPFGYMRIDLPQKKTYKTYQSTCGYSFNYPEYAFIEKKDDCNLTLHFSQLKASLFCTYVSIGEGNSANKFFFHSEYSRKLAYEHTIKADKISEELLANKANKVYGIAYNIDGNVASNYQFYVTDSVSHFFRGSLYFNITPNVDSIKPVLEYLKEDIRQLVNTLKWN